MTDRVPLTEERIREIRERVEKATPGPWFTMNYCGIGDPEVDAMVRRHAGGGIDVKTVLIHEKDLVTGADFTKFYRAPQCAADAAFIAAARQDVPDLLAEVTRLREREAVLARAVRLMQAEIDAQESNAIACAEGGTPKPATETGAREALSAALALLEEKP